MRYTFGPVNSRRFGLSLGIDLSPDIKSCNFNCLYCELEAADPIDHIKYPPKVKDIIKDVKLALSKRSDIDVITITSNGEPTLYEDLDILVDELNMIKGDKKLLILSNSSTIMDFNIQNILKKIDIVKLSLDSVEQKVFKKVDRPIDGVTIDNIVDGIKTFSKNFNNDLIIEVLIVKGINDKKEQIKALNDVLLQINPSRIDLGTIDRPPAFNVQAVSSEVLKDLSTIFKGVPISIIHKDRPKVKMDFEKDDILRLIKRRPQSQSDIDYLFSSNSKKALLELIEDKEVIKKSVAGVLFYFDTSRILSR